jgi:hypothetical protein
MITQEETITARAWIGCLGCYNGGTLNGAWVDGLNAGEIDKALNVKIGDPAIYGANCQICTACGSDEFWVFDHEGYAGLIKGECSPIEAQEAAELLQTIAEESGDLEAGIAWVNWTGKDWDADSFRDDFQGRYDSFMTFAEELAQELYGQELEAARWPFSCIDWDRAARDLSFDYYEDTAASNGDSLIFRAC